jgi:hypothetical protein
MQWKNSLTVLALGAALSLTGCGGSDSKDAPTPVSTPTVSLKVVHAAVDAPAVNATSGDVFNANNIAFGKASPAVKVPATGIGLAVSAILPDNTTTAVLTPSLTFAPGQTYTAYAVGRVADNSLGALLVNAPDNTPSAGNALLQVVHAAAGAPTVDVHLTAPTATLSSSTVTATLPFRQFTGAVSVPAGDYRIRVTPAGAPATVVFDSGTVAIAAGANLQVAAINNRFAGPSPVSLLTVDPNGATSDIRDVNSTTAVRVVHAVADAPAVDVLLNNSRAITNLKYPEFTGYAQIRPGAYNVKVAANANNAVVVINADLNLAAGNFATILATGSLAANSIRPWVLADTPRRVATAAQVRIAHASTVAGRVDIYVTATRDISTSTPAFRDVPFMAETGYVNLKPGSYVVTVTPTGSKTAAIGPVQLQLAGNKIYTAVARDGIAGAAPGLILLDDFNP